LTLILQELDEQAKLSVPLIGELKASLPVYCTSEDHKVITELFQVTVLPILPIVFIRPHEFRIILQDIFGEDIPKYIDHKDHLIFSLPA